MNQSPRRMCLAKIATAHGVRGMVKLHVYAEDPRSIDSYGPLYTSENDGKALTLTIKNPLGKYWLAEIKGITDRNESEKLRGIELWVDRDKLPNPEEGEHYHADLIGMNVQDKDGAALGKVIAVENFGASDLLDIKPASGSSFYLPFADQFIIEVTADSITVDMPEGLLK